MKPMFTHISMLLATLCACTPLLHAQSATVTPATATPAQSAEIKEMQKLEDQWSDAVVKRDQYGLELLLSPLYVGISSSGEVTTRNQQIAALFQRSVDPLTMEQRVVSVRMLGDVAVVNGTYIVRRKDNSTAVEERGIFTHVFQRVRSNWLCINAQRTLIAEGAPGKQQKVTKKSNAELPFHVPFIHKGADSTQQQQPPAQTDTQANQQQQPPQ
ncbi:MAG TPA: nuclear transport factor 2 family protein [Pseudacidobacterium sp.]|jgi:ketosteroid isomerase-like protein|nr:nuclear transport factor 2 family protein [Pseudacidobacterium sp.]